MEDDKSLLYACVINDLHLIKERLQNVKLAQLKKSTREHGTPLHAAALNGNQEAVDLLLAAGASMEAGNFLNNNAMLTCIERGQLNMAKYLIEKGSDVNKKGCQYRAALSQLICFSWDRNFAEYLLEKGSEINQVARDKQSLLSDAASLNLPEAIDFLLEKGIDRSHFNSALCWSIIHNGVDAATVLMDRGANLEEMYASCKGIEKGLYHTIATRKGYDQMIRLLIGKGVNFDKTPDRAVVIGLDKTKLSPLAHAKQHLEKWPGETYLLEHIRIMENHVV